MKKKLRKKFLLTLNLDVFWCCSFKDKTGKAERITLDNIGASNEWLDILGKNTYPLSCRELNEKIHTTLKCIS